MFRTAKFEHSSIEEALQKEFGKRFEYEPTSNKHFGVFCNIENAKVDIVHLPHPRTAAIETIEEIRMYSSSDIAAMKIQATLGRGRKKDF